MKELDLFTTETAVKRQITQPRTPAGQWVKKSVHAHYDAELSRLTHYVKGLTIQVMNLQAIIRQKNEQIKSLKQLLQAK